MLKVDLYPTIGAMKAMSVKRRDVLDDIDAKADAGRFAQSTQVLAVVRKLFGWAVENNSLASSPAAGVKPRAKAVERDRVLADEEMPRSSRRCPTRPDMSKALSVDLRERILKADGAGATHREAAERFGLSAASVAAGER
jgi:hypothetical protein